MSSKSYLLQGEILKFIRQRHFESGDRLFSEREFAERFGTTRPAIREAVTALEALRVIERRPQSGLYLRDMRADSSIDALVLQVQSGMIPDAHEIHDAIELRRILEIEAIRIAATRRSEDDLKDIRQVLDQTEERLNEGQPIEKEDEEFHKRIAASTRNGLLLRVVNSFYELSKDRRVMYFSDPERCRISHAQHLKIFATLSEGDPERCAKIMRDHLSETSTLWKTILAEEVS